MENSKFLELNINHFLIEKWAIDSFNANIRDENNNIVGKMLSTRDHKRLISLRNGDHSVILEAFSRDWPLPANWKIEDSEGNIIGMIKKKRFSFKKNMEIENPDGDVVLIAKRVDKKHNFEIVDKDGNKIVEFSNNHSKDIFILHIKNSQFNKKLLWGLFVCMYFSVFEFGVMIRTSDTHDGAGGGDVGGGE